MRSAGTAEVNLGRSAHLGLTRRLLYRLVKLSPSRFHSLEAGPMVKSTDFLCSDRLKHSLKTKKQVRFFLKFVFHNKKNSLFNPTGSPNEGVCCGLSAGTRRI